MPVYMITYTTPTYRDRTEWVCPDGYDSRTAREAFRKQHPAAAVATTVKVPSGTEQ
jgi:hypothetical protein